MPVFDSNILIHTINKTPSMIGVIEGYDDWKISIISWIEVITGAQNPDNTKHLKDFLSQFQVINISYQIAEKAAELRRDYKLRLPDSVIYATALCDNNSLITRNTKDFRVNMNNIVIP